MTKTALFGLAFAIAAICAGATGMAMDWPRNGQIVSGMLQASAAVEADYAAGAIGAPLPSARSTAVAVR